MNELNVSVSYKGSKGMQNCLYNTSFLHAPCQLYKDGEILAQGVTISDFAKLME